MATLLPRGADRLKSESHWVKIFCSAAAPILNRRRQQLPKAIPAERLCYDWRSSTKYSFLLSAFRVNFLFVQMTKRDDALWHPEKTFLNIQTYRLTRWKCCRMQDIIIAIASLCHIVIVGFWCCKTWLSCILSQSLLLITTYSISSIQQITSKSVIG